MSFSRKIKYFLVHTLQHSNKAAQELIEDGKVEIDGVKVVENCPLQDHSEIKVNGITERKKKKFIYYRFYKPVGLESTLHKSIPDNLAAFFTEHKDLAIAGRLDKQSEGLLLLSNDGKWVEKMCNPKFEKEKEYLVKLDRRPDKNFIWAFSKGLIIGDYLTAPCICRHLTGCEVKIILKEGKNRQIRRMCKVLNYEVIALKRVRVDSIQLKKLKSGEKEQFENKIQTFDN